MSEPSGPLSQFFRARWRGAVPVRRLLLWDMLFVGSALNIAVGFIAFLGLALGLPGPLAVGIFLSPLPYNVFLMLAVWRAAPAGAAGSAMRTAAVIWCIIVTLI